jgi:hypothetical protein
MWVGVMIKFIKIETRICEESACEISPNLALNSPSFQVEGHSFRDPSQLKSSVI